MSKIKRLRIKTQEGLCLRQSEMTISLCEEDFKWKRTLLNKRRSWNSALDAFRKLTGSISNWMTNVFREQISLCEIVLS